MKVATDEPSSIVFASVEGAPFAEKANTVTRIRNQLHNVRSLARSVALQASGAGDNTVRFWDINTETPRHECRAHRQYVLALAWAPDGRRLASGDKVRALRSCVVMAAANSNA